VAESCRRSHAERRLLRRWIALQPSPPQFCSSQPRGWWRTSAFGWPTCPLERDEGEYAYAGQLILAGVPPYELAYNVKFPGAYYAYAAIMAVFGQTPWAIRMGLLCVNGATVGLVFLLGKRMLGTLAGAVGASAFALLAIDRWSMGVFAHATHFMSLPAVAGVLILLHAMRGGRAWLFVTAGVLMGGLQLRRGVRLTGSPCGCWCDVRARVGTTSRRRTVDGRVRAVLVAWALAGALAVIPGFFFRPHYFSC
jgi:hypothetical protein